MTWQELEKFVHKKLEDRGIAFEAEGVLRSYGHRHGKGKSDVFLKNYNIPQIEIKNIQKLSDLTLPSSSYDTTRIKGHQIRSLRRAGPKAGLFIHENSTDRFFWCNMAEYERLILENYKRRSMRDIDHLEIDVDIFFDSIKRVTRK